MVIVGFIFLCLIMLWLTLIALYIHVDSFFGIWAYNDSWKYKLGSVVFTFIIGSLWYALYLHSPLTIALVVA